ncbi:glycosyltransferase [Clostridium beijerinckii]|uniref:glycosyltransferase n=1 Tax=Clostridium beijerinckii TaxID=1520 RepID=UPI0014944B72|nr:glycosyltransferase [Clostridium beijerinckii]NOW06514.1 glycosyltransferase involved in cell wall biosynthesis [Clostridium beijerinckii]NYC00342.1 glycosyltransferase involved in cell wall biosynthesis [Clostridium beijerinckii]
MERIKMLKQKSIDTLKNDGIKTFAKKTLNYIKKSRQIERSVGVDKHYLDVLFINGCFLPQTRRYRISHQREQLMAAGILSDEVFYEDLSLELIRNYRVFVFFRCPITETIREFIKKCKEHNKVIIFDVDDLVIDRRYTDEIKYIKAMSKEEKAKYDSGVDKMKETLCMCDMAITTTERLAEELKKYVPEVYINRNTASNRMLELSELAVYNRDVLPSKNIKYEKNKKEIKKIMLAKKKLIDTNKVKLGYFSGSITHNDDILMILPVIVKIMNENCNVELHLVGELDIPKELEKFKNRIVFNAFVNWEKLPGLIANVDINIVPLEDTIFNEAKSENKWIEASLVKVVTVASKVGALEKMILHNETGFLCSNNDEWYKALTELIHNSSLRKEVAENACKYVYKHCTTLNTAFKFGKYIRSKMKPNIAFVLPSTQIGGGMLVVLKHCLILKEAGFDVLIINDGFENKNLKFEEKEVLCFSRHSMEISGNLDKCVATLWSTLDFVVSYPNIRDRYYLVQGLETNFNKNGSDLKIKANATYCNNHDIKYITISKWCEKWLKEDYHKESKFAPNGLNISRFNAVKRMLDNDKIRILVEGNCDDYYKNVDESFEIVEKLDKNKFEIWYMSYQGEPKKFYYVDKFLHKVPYEEVPNIYKQCDILIKSSILESFSYPPLEMMATGGFVVAALNDGNSEYLVHEQNSLVYNVGDIDFAVECIERIVNDEKLRIKLMENGIRTAKERSWGVISDEILQLYN